MDAAASLDTNFIFALVAGIIGMLAFSLVVILFVVFYQRKMVRQRERMNQLEVEHQKDLLSSTIHAQENERKRIAVDLHDGIGGLLSAAKLYINQLRPEMVDTDYRVIKEEANALLDETIGNIRTIHHDLQPASLENLGLISAVEGLCKRFCDFLTIELYYQQELRFNNTKEVTLFRIIQELLNNTLKHSEAQKVAISFVFNTKELVINYQDNGKGFDLSEIKAQKKQESGLGLKSIESRIGAINGQLEYQTAVGKGVKVKITTPLD